MNPRLILSVIACLLAFAPVTASSAEITGQSISPSFFYDKDGLTVTLQKAGGELTDVIVEGEAFQTLDLASEAMVGQPGGPALPVSTRLIEIPAGMEAVLSIEQGTVETIEGVKLAPMPLSSSDNLSDGPVAIQPDIYALDHLIPAETVFLSKPFHAGDRRYAVLTISPYQYNPLKKRLLVHEGLRASVRFNPGESRPIDNRFDSPAWRELSAALNEGPPRDDATPRSDNLGHLVIVVPNIDEFEESIQPLVEWKKRMGYVVTVVRMVRDLENNESSLKAYLEEAWEEWDLPPTFILLVGESTRMPYYRDNQAEGASWYISDNHFVTYGFNPDGGNIQSWIPQSFIGRLPAANAGEVTKMVTKIVGYESDPYVDQNWIEGGLMIAAGVHSCIQTNQAIREMLMNYGYAGNRVREAYAEYHAGQPTVDANIVNSAVNDGVGFVNFRGYDLWGGPNIPTVVSQIQQFQNAWKLPIVTGMVCATNDFANRFGGESVGEAWVRAYRNNSPTGAVASFGPTDRHTHTWFNNTMDGEFYRLLLRRGVHSLGALTVGSKMSLLRNFPSLNQLNNGLSNGYYFYTYTLFGDPSMQVRTRNPMEMTVAFDDDIPVGSTNLHIRVLDVNDEPVVGAYAHYFGDDDHRYGTYTDLNGEGLLETPPLEQGTLLLTVTATNYIPFQGEMDVSAQSRIASLSAIAFDDDGEGQSRGNGDALINPGEMLEITATLANRGSDVLRDVRATLESESPYVEILRSSAEFGTLEQDAEGSNGDFYLIEIAPGTPSGTRIDFLLNITAGEDNFPIYFTREVNGYDFSIRNLETVGGDLVPGTSRQLVVTIRNDGRLDAASTIGTLYCSDRGIQLRGAEARFDRIDVGDQISNAQHPFELTAGPTAYRGGTINLGLVLEDEDGLRDSLGFQLVLGEAAVNSPQGPDLHGYWAIDSRDTATGIAPRYERLQGNNNLNLTDNNDVVSAVGIGGAVRTIDLPFAFIFYGERYNRITVSSNGFLAFGESISIGWNNQELGSGLTPAAMVAAWWDDLYSGSVFTQFDEDNSRFIIEWRNFMGGGAQRLNFSVVLYDPTVVVTQTGDGEIVINYTEIPALRDLPDEPVTIGICSDLQNKALTVRHARTSDFRTGQLSSGMAVKFTTGESEDVGSLEGRVTNVATGMPMPGVRVMLEGTGFFSITDVNGDYSIVGAAEGTYAALARKRFFNDDNEADVVIVRDEVTVVDFSLTQPLFRIDIEDIDVIVPPDSIRYREFRVNNDGNGPLDFKIILNYQPEEARDDPWDMLFDWDVSAVTDEQNLRGVAMDKDFFYLSGQRTRARYPHPIYVLNKEGELIREFDQFAVDSAARGYACMEFNGENLAAVEERSIVELTTEGQFVRSITTPERTASLSIAYSPEAGTYFTKGITGNEIYEIDVDGNLVRGHPVPEASFRTYGFAWSPAEPGGYSLYVTRFDQDNGIVTVHRMNPNSDDWQLVRMLELENGDAPLDMMITKRYEPLLWTLVVLVNRQGGDRLIGYELMPNTTWIEYEPKDGSIPAEGEQEFDLTFISEDMPLGTYNVVLELNHNAEGEKFEIPVAFTVGDEVSVRGSELQPASISLESLYPNPFNSRARATFSLQAAGPASLIIYDASGRELQKLHFERLEAGRHTAELDGAELSSGLYLVKLETATGSASRKMVLMR